MKSVGGIWDLLLDIDTMLEAYRLASKGKQQVPEVRRFRENLHPNLRRIIGQLEEGTFTFGPYRTFTIHDPKTRSIQVAPFEQRVVHHAIIQVAGPAMERSLVFDTYACRKGKGQHAAARRLQSFAKRHGWYLKMDVRKFYDSVGHECLLGILASRFRERRLRELFAGLVRSYSTSAGNGLPIGNLTSQYFGNLYLDALDHRIKEVNGRVGYVRYMDDMVVLGNRRDGLLRLRDDICQWLYVERALTVKNGGELNRVDRGIPFVGFVVYPERMRLHSRVARRYSRRLKQLKRDYRVGLYGAMEVQQRATALVAATHVANAESFRRSVEQRQMSMEGYA